MQYILAHDLGTSGDKATIFSVDGTLVGSAVYAYQTDYFNGTWAEQDANDWWRAVCTTTKDLIAEIGILPEEIAAVSFSGQMMGCLCVDRNGIPMRKSIIWADQRAQKQAAEIESHISQQDFYRIAGHRNTAYYGVQKLMWIRDNEPEIYANTYKVLNAKDYIVYRLTGKYYTEYSDANSMTCFDLNKLAWSERLVDYAGIDGDKLPEAKPSTFVAGGVTAAAAEACGLAVKTPVVMGAGDGVTANIGAGSIQEGKTYCCMGTSAWITTTSEKPIFDANMRTVTWAHAIPGLYAPNGTMQFAGGSYNWLKNTICLAEKNLAEQTGMSPYQYMNEQIEESSAGSNGVLFLPYLMGERAPRWNYEAKGAFIGLKADTTRSDILRSVLEGITMNLGIVLDILRESLTIDEVLVIGGGAKGAIWRQIMADIWDTKILVPSVLEEAGSMGAAVIGGVGAGLYRDFSAIDKFIEIAHIQEPNPVNVQAYQRPKQNFDACYYALEKVYAQL